MADQFVGLTVFLTVKDAENTQLRGLVADVLGQELALTNVYFPKTGRVCDNYRVSGPSIRDIEIVNEDYVPIPPPVQLPQQPQRHQAQPQQHHQQHQLQPPFQQQQHHPQLPFHPSQNLQYNQHNQHNQHPQHSHHPQYPQHPQHPQGYPLTLHSGVPPGIQPQHHQQNSPFYNVGPRYPPNIPPFAPPPVSQQPTPAPAPAFEDPAIVSMSRKPAAAAVPLSTKATRPTSQLKPPPPQPNFTVITPTRTPAQTVSSTMSRGGSMGPKLSSSSQGSGAPLSNGPKMAHAVNATLESQRSAAATLQQEFTKMSLRTDAAESSAFEETDDASSMYVPKMAYNQRNNFTGKRSRRGKGFLQKSDQFLEPIQQESSVVLQPGLFGGAVAQAAAASVGGRYPIQPGSNRRMSKRRQRYENGNYANADEEGWATEDVTDFKETEFDFQSNLNRFDKKTVFSQIKAEDTTADEARLVSFNRLPRRDKAPPKKNYRHTENVLGTYSNGASLADRDDWHSQGFADEQSEDSDDEDEDVDLRGRVGAANSGRSSRRAMSRQSVSNRMSARQLSSSNIVGRDRSADNLRALSSSGSAVMNKPGKPSFRLAPNNRPCPIVSPLQMLDVERIAEVELGLTDDMMTENGGRGIAQVAIQAFGKRISATNHNALPVVLVFAGNNKSGARAIAAGRHLKNHHVRVMVCVLGLEREDELLENVRRQLNIFRMSGGRVARWEELQGNLKGLDSPPELIIDGLLGTHLGFEDLRTDDQTTAFELVQFANKSKASVLSVDIPSGVDGSTGEIAQLEDTDAFYMRAKWVVCMGAPKSGLLNAISLGVGAGWTLWVADIGISNTAWRKYGTRRRHGVEFSAEWVVPLSYVGGSI